MVVRTAMRVLIILLLLATTACDNDTPPIIPLFTPPILGWETPNLAYATSRDDPVYVLDAGGTRIVRFDIFLDTSSELLEGYDLPQTSYITADTEWEYKTVVTGTAVTATTRLNSVSAVSSTVAFTPYPDFNTANIQILIAADDLYFVFRGVQNDQFETVWLPVPKSQIVSGFASGSIAPDYSAAQTTAGWLKAQSLVGGQVLLTSAHKIVLGESSWETTSSVAWQQVALDTAATSATLYGLSTTGSMLTVSASTTAIDVLAEQAATDYTVFNFSGDAVTVEALTTDTSVDMTPVDFASEDPVQTITIGGQSSAAVTFAAGRRYIEFSAFSDSRLWARSIQGNLIAFEKDDAWSAGVTGVSLLLGDPAVQEIMREGTFSFNYNTTSEYRYPVTTQTSDTTDSGQKVTPFVYKTTKKSEAQVTTRSLDRNFSTVHLIDPATQAVGEIRIDRTDRKITPIWIEDNIRAQDEP